jgi:hypothetical protein
LRVTEIAAVEAVEEVDQDAGSQDRNVEFAIPRSMVFLLFDGGGDVATLFGVEELLSELGASCHRPAG